MLNSITRKSLFSGLIITVAILGAAGMYICKENSNDLVSQSSNNAPERIFKNRPFITEHKPRILRTREQAAKELETFLNGARLTEENLVAINNKFLVVGLHIDENSKVTLLPDSQWNAVVKTADVTINMIPDDTMVSQKKVLHIDTTTPVIKPDSITEEEEEEESVQGNTAKSEVRENKIKQREIQLKSYLYSVFQSSINRVNRNGNRKTIINDYLDETFDYYGHKRNQAGL